MEELYMVQNGRPCRYVANSRLINEAINYEQIEAVRSRTNVGDSVSFTDDNGKRIDGKVTAVYSNIFFLDNGKNYTWIQYLIGNPFLKHRIKEELDRLSEVRLYEKHERSFLNYGSEGIREKVQESPRRHKYVNRCKSHLRTTLSLDELEKLRKVMKGI